MSNDFEISMVDESTAKKILGIRGWFLKGEKREMAIVSKLVDIEIKKRKKSGEKLSDEDIDKIKFAHDPVFKQKIIDKVHSDCDREYRQRVKDAENTVSRTISSRTKEIKRIEESRWEKIILKNLKYNLTEGVISINDNKAPFTSISGAAINISESYRIETEEKGKSQKHASVGGALVGGLCFGAVGAIVGGTALGKTTHEGTVNTNNIPTATHVGIVIEINGFRNEISILDKTVDQDSKDFRNAVQTVQDIITKLQWLTTQPVPESFLKPEEEASVLAIDQKIIEAQKALDFAKSNIPTYEIPPRYL